MTKARNIADGVDAGDIASSAVTTDKIADGNVTTDKIADVNVTTGKIADNAITLAKMASGTDGNLISYDTSGNPVAVATGSTGQVLTSAGAGAVPSFATAAAGGSMVYLATTGTISSGTASVTLTAFDASKYDNYMFIFELFKPVNDSVLGQWQVSSDGGSNYITTYRDFNEPATTQVTQGFFSPYSNSAYYSYGNATNEYGANGSYRLFSPHNTSMYSAFTSESAFGYDNGNRVMQQSASAAGGSQVESTASLNAIKFYFSAGNIASGKILMYGIAKS
jgi:hypothetical protein